MADAWVVEREMFLGLPVVFRRIVEVILVPVVPVILAELAAIPPVTSNITVGLVFPIPTFPLSNIANLLVPSASLVKKEIPELVPIPWTVNLVVGL